MAKTAHSILTIRNSIVFEGNNFYKSNQLENGTHHRIYVDCLFDPISHPNCIRFKLGDIVKFTSNARGDYEELAKFGAIILITIKWNCWVESIFNEESCSLVYSFERIDDDDKPSSTGKNGYETQMYFENGFKRTMIRSHRIRLQIKVSATLNQYDFYSLITVMAAYTAVFSLLLSPFQMAIMRRLKKYHIEDWINVED